MGDDRPPVYTDGDFTVYRASSLGGCTRALVACRLGYETSPPPDKTQEMFDAGTAAEDRAMARLDVQGLKTKFHQKEYHLHVTGKVIVRAHIDAMSAGPRWDREMVVEVKSQSADEWERVGHAWSAPVVDAWRRDDLWSKYLWQFSVLMHATGKPLMVVRINRDQPSAEGNMVLTEVDDPPYSLAEVRARVLQVEMYARRGVLPDVCDRPMFPCPVWRTHPEEDVKEPVEVTDSAVDGYARAYLHTAELVRDLEAKKKELRGKLRHASLEDRYRTASGIVVTFVQAQTRRFSEKLMRDRGLDPEELKEDGVQERIDVKGAKE